MKLKTGIIGCGKVGDFHAKAYAQLENSEFTAVCDADLERAKAFAERYNVHAYSDIAEMIQKEHLDVVSVCTPHPIHCDPAVTAAENGCNVLIEKPLASSLADCDRIIEAGDKNHVTIGTMVQRRFYRPCMRIHEAIEAGKIGKPVLGMVTMLGWRDKAYYDSDAWRGTWKGEGGGLLINQGQHILDMFQYLFGMPQRIFAVIPFGKYNNFAVDDEDTIIMSYDNGMTASFVLTTGEACYEERLEVIGTKAKLLLEDNTLIITRHQDVREYIKTENVNSRENMHFTQEIIEYEKEPEPYTRLLEGFAKASLEQNSDYLVARGEEGINSLMLCTGAYYSACRGIQVELPLDADEYRKLMDELISKEQ